MWLEKTETVVEICEDPPGKQPATFAGEADNNRSPSKWDVQALLPLCVYVCVSARRCDDLLPTGPQALVEAPSSLFLPRQATTFSPTAPQETSE